MHQEYRVYIEEILEAIQQIESYTLNMSYEDFARNRMVLDAVLRNLEIIGEAVKNIPYDAKKKYRSIEWKKIAGLRDILIHEYFGIDVEIIWDIVKNKVPQLKMLLKQISRDFKNGSEK